MTFGVAAVAVLTALAAVSGGQGGGDRAVSRGAPHSQQPEGSDLPGFVLQAPPVDAGPLRYDTEYPAIPYSTGARTDRVAALVARINRGDVKLEYRAPRGYLDSLLAALEIDPSSQTLVYSQTSLQGRLISPSLPRAVYFNDDVYVAWVQNGPIEIASQDPNLGPVFYLLEQNGAMPPKFEGELTKCLACHDSYSLSGEGVPRYIVGSGYTGITGMLVSHEGWILVTDRTLLRGRSLTGALRESVEAGVPAIQLRERDLSTRELLSAAWQLHAMTQACGVPLIINDRVDIAMALDLAGVHLRASSLPVSVARRVLGPHRLVGVSAHSVREVHQAGDHRAVAERRRQRLENRRGRLLEDGGGGLREIRGLAGDPGDVVDEVDDLEPGECIEDEFDEGVFGRETARAGHPPVRAVEAEFAMTPGY